MTKWHMRGKAAALVVVACLALAGCAGPNQDPATTAAGGPTVVAPTNPGSDAAFKKKKAKKKAAVVDTTKYAVAVCNLLTGMTEEQIVRKAAANQWPIKGPMAEFVHTAHMTLCPRVR